MAVTRPRTIAYFIFHFAVVISAHKCYIQSEYTDDSDYQDLEFYEDMTDNYIKREGHSDMVQDDLYISSNIEDANMQNNVYSHKNDYETTFANKNSPKKRSPIVRIDWYKPEKVYRYTKHRIPGYDYEELDYVITKSFQQCDGRSVWTHCLCQFTCSEPDAVDCYTPCKSGCECKEDYVYDEKTKQCLLPEQCSPKEENYYTI